MVHEENTIINVKLEKNMTFRSELGYQRVKELCIDESLEKNKEPLGPDAAQLLGMALLSCLNASFIFCLNKRNLMIDDLEATGEISFKKNEKGYMRIDKIDVKIKPTTEDPEVMKRVQLCLKEMKSGHMFFEETCIITPSIREGISINVSVDF